jgi:hypothetical protein
LEASLAPCDQPLIRKLSTMNTAPAIRPA